MATKKTRKPTVSPTTDDSLRLSQETLRAIIDTAVDGIITIDGRGTMLTMNPAAEKLFGYRSEEVIGRNVKMLMPAPFREAHDGYLKNYLDTGNKKIIGIGREVVGTRKDGSTFPLYLGVGEMKIGDKHYFTGITRDLSDIKNAEKLRETNEELKSQVWIRQGEAELYERMRGEQALAGFSRNILSFLCEYLDARVGAIYLKSDEQLKRSAVYAYSSGDGKESFGLGEGLVGQVAVDHKPILLDHVPSNYIKVTSAIGEGSPASVLILPLLYEGKIQGVLELGFLERIDAAGSKMSFLQGVTDSIGIGINSSKSRRLAELLAETQRQAEELQMQQEELRVTNEELETQTTALRRSQARLQAQQEELQQINAELEERTKAIEEQRETLKQKNAELSRTQEDLEEKARQLELSGKYKSEFLANMSHELRTPLNSILILAKLLVENRQQNLTKEQVDFAATIQTSGVALVTLINDILDLAKVEAGRLEIRPEPVELTELAASMESSFRMDAKGRNLGFEIDVQPGLSPSIRTDRSRVEQILRNLISNALKFTKQGEVKLRLFKPDPASVPAKLSADSRRTIAFEVADTGVGISKDFQKVIFEPFRQADGTTSRKYGGTGLGLAISRELASLLGGDILIDSEEGKGSRFTLFLPEEFREAAVKPEVTVFQEKDKAVGVPSASRGTDSAATAPIARKGVTAPQAEKTVLIIEDDPGFSKVLSALAEERGFKSIVAGDGERGLECLETSIPSGILLDLKLPGIDGLSVLERIKADPRTRHVPVHIISGAEAESESLRKGAMGFLHKPVDEDDLREAFTRIEALAFRKVKRLLVVEDDPIQRESIVSLIRGAEVEIYTAATAKQAYDYLKTQSVDCMVVDLGLPDFSGFEFLEQIAHDESISAPPIIVYTARDLTRAEEQKLKTYSSSIIIKGARSPERLLDEVSLFLHQVEDKLPKEKQRILLRVRDEVFQNKKVLLVDDDMRNVYALSSVLEDRGLQVLVAKNGHEALAQLEATPTIDLVLMDIMMPEMDGYEAMREIRKQRRFQTLPILAITAKAMQEDRKKCLDAGANDYIPKPINVDQLLTLLRVWLSRHV